MDLHDDDDGISFEIALTDLPGSLTLMLWKDDDGLRLTLEAPPPVSGDGHLVIEPIAQQPGSFHLRAR